MRKIFLQLFVILILTALNVGAGSASNQTETTGSRLTFADTAERKIQDVTLLYETARPSLCMIAALDPKGSLLMSGSGFIISKDGQVLTNAHVVSGATSVQVDCGGQKGNATQTVGYRQGVDLVILQTDLSHSIPLAFSQRKEIKTGETVFALGNPYGLAGTLTTGIVGGTREFDGSTYLQISADINPGNSGGPVMDSLGQVIGIATSRLEGSQGINFALTSNMVSTLPVVSISFDKITPPDQESPMETVPVSKLSFRGIPLGSNCNEVLKQGKLVYGPWLINRLNIDGDPNSEFSTAKGKVRELKESRLMRDPKYIEFNKNPRLNPSGMNWIELELMDQPVGGEYECYEGTLVGAGYTFIPSSVIEIFFKAILKKYGNPNRFDQSILTGDRDKDRDIKATQFEIENTWAEWLFEDGQKILFVGRYRCSSFLEVCGNKVFYSDNKLLEFLKEKGSSNISLKDDI